MNVIKIVIACYKFLPRKSKKIYLLLTSSFSFLSILDILGLLLSGLIITKLDGSALKSLNILNNSPEFLQRIIQQLNLSTLVVAALIFFLTKSMLALVGSKAILTYLGNLSTSKSTSVFQNFTKSEVQEVESMQSQKISYTVTSGIGSAYVDILGSFSQILADVVLLALIMIALLASNFILTLTVIVYFFFIFVGINLKLSRLARMSGKIKYESFVSQNEIVLDSISRFRELSVSGEIRELNSRFNESKTKSMRALVNWQWMNNAPKYIIEFSLFLGLAAIAAAHKYFQDFVSIQDIGFFLVASSRIAPSLLRIQQSNTAIQTSQESINQTLEIASHFSGPTKIDESGIYFRQTTKYIAPPTVACENLSFRYQRSKSDVISNLSLSIKSGEFVVFVGETGVGKSTLFDLLTGVLAPCSGEVLIGEFTAREYLLQNIGGMALVEQEQKLPNDSLVKIITGQEYKKLNSGDQLLFNKLVEQLGLGGLGLNSVDGLEIRIGENGQQVSGGEKQRIAIARALFQKPALLFLDEVTSALDPATQSTIERTLNSFKGEVTILMITHSLDISSNADQIIRISREFLTGSV